MRRIGVLTCLLALATVTAAARTQEAAKKAAMLPAPGASAALLKQWNDIGRKLIAMAEDFPSDKFDFKAAPSSATFAERLLHAAAANYFFTNVALGQKPPTDAEAFPSRAQFKDKTAIIAYVKKSFADGAAAIKSKGDSGLAASVVDPFAQDNLANAGKEQIRLVDLGYGLVEHSGECYGQLTVYYRTAGMVPPESRPSN